MVSPLFSNSYLSPASHQGGQFCHDEEGAQPAVPGQLRDTMPKARRYQAETRAGSRAGFFVLFDYVRVHIYNEDGYRYLSLSDGVL